MEDSEAKLYDGVQSSGVGARGAVQSRRLVMDANILVRAMLGVRVRELIGS